MQVIPSELLCGPGLIPAFSDQGRFSPETRLHEGDIGCVLII